MSRRLQKLLLLLLLSCFTITSFGSETADVVEESNAEEVREKTEESSHDTEDEEPSQDEKKSQKEDTTKLLPHVLTSRNFGRSISDKNVWLVEIYAPWCGHCVSFAPTYNEIASYYHSEKNAKRGIRVGKVDGDAERALSTRFHVQSYPSFYVIDGWSVYKFEQSQRTKSNLIKFVEGDYKKESAMPFYASPLGPLGIAQEIIISAGYTFTDVFSWLQETFGLSPVFAGMIMFGGAFVGCFIMIVFLAILLTTPGREKQD